MTRLDLKVLGPLALRIAGGPLVKFSTDKGQALLAYLALEPGQPHPRRKLATLLWPDVADKHALHSLRTALYDLRQALNKAAPNLSETLLTITRQTVQFNPAGLRLDATAFQTLLAASEAHPHSRLADCADCLGLLEQAAELYRGEFLTGFSLADAAPFEEWLLFQREILHQQALLVCQNLAEAYETNRNYERGYTYATRLTNLDPYREASQRRLMRLLALRGLPDQALAQYATCRQLLREAFGAEPEAETVALAAQIQTGSLQPPAAASPAPDKQLLAGPPPAQAHPYLDVPDPGPFFGRLRELAQLQQWLLADGCRIVAILGLGGMGKTSLAAQCIHTVAAGEAQSGFDLVLWRSLVNAPPLSELLPPILQHLSGQQLAHPPDSFDEQLRLLLGYLRERRVLLALDNLESILEPAQAGAYRAGYEGYGQLIQHLATYPHQSLLLFTSRVRPRHYARLEGDSPLVRALQLSGLDERAGHQLLAQRGVHGNNEDEVALLSRYSGNPLALKLVADTVDELFGGDLQEFLVEDNLIFDDIRVVLDAHFGRLTELEQQILLWLAVEREPISTGQLRQNLLQSPPQRELIDALRNLQRRSLIERQESRFGLQNVITEYLTERLIVSACQELQTGELHYLHRQALLKAQAKEYVRQSQARMVLQPIGDHLLAQYGRGILVERLRDILDRLRQQAPHTPSYAGGNILNLLLQLKLDATGLDFSRLTIWEAYLRSASLPAVNFAGADMARVALGSVFGDIRSLAFSPKGQLVAVGTLGGEVSLWRTDDAQLIAVLKDDAAPIWSVAFSPDGVLLASGGADRIIRLWDVASAQLRDKLLGHTKTIRCLAYSPDGRTLASGGDDRTVYLWDIQRRQLLGSLEPRHDYSVFGISFSPRGDILASGSEDRKIHLWDLSTRAIQQILLGHDELIRAVAFSPDGETLASGSHDQTILLWDLGAGQIKQRLPGHKGWVESVAFSPDGKILASSGDDQTVRLWDVNDGQLQHTFLGHTSNVTAIAFSPNGDTLVSGDNDRNLFLWDMPSRQPRHHLLGYLVSVESVAFSGDGKVLSSGNGDQTVRFWSLAESKRTDMIHYVPKGQPIHVGHVTVVACSLDGRTLASGDADATIHLLDVNSEQIQHILHGHGGMIKSIAFNPKGTILASGGTDRTIRLWDVERGQLLRTLEGHAGWVNGLAFSPDNKVLASGGGDQMICLWDVYSGKCYLTLKGHVGWVNDLVFSPDGGYLISGGADQTIRLWDLQSGQILQTLEGHRGWVWKVAITDDGKILASGSKDQTVRLWDIATVFNTTVTGGKAEGGAKLRHILTGHTPWVTDIALNSQARILASSSGHQTIRLWHIDTGECLQTLKIPGPYDGMNITSVTGITEAQKAVLKALGAVEEPAT